MSEQKTVLVTGGAGFIGSHLVDALAARGDRVRVVDNLSVGSLDNLSQQAGNPRVTVHQVDVRDGRALAPLFDGVDTVFHLATQCVRVSLSEPELVHEVNTTGTLQVLLAAAHSRVRRFVYVSSSEAFGSARVVPMREDHPFEPTTIYGASKMAGELYTNAFRVTYGLHTVIVRPFNTYGPRAHFNGAYGELIPKFVVRVENGLPPVVFGDGEQTRDFTYVTDTVAGMIGAADSTLDGQSVNIARGREVSINEIARIVLGACGRAGLLSPTYGPPRPADVRRHHADIALARRSLGFEPAIDIDEGIRRYVAWFRQTYPDPAPLLAEEQPYNWTAPHV